MVTINPDSKLVPTWYQSKNDIEWQLKPLSGFEFMQVQSGARITEDGHMIYSGQAQRDALKAAIRDWRGVTNPQNEPISYRYQLLDLLPVEHLNDVFNEILNRAMVREYEQKNSSSQSQSTVTQSNSTASTVSGGDTATNVIQPPSNSGA